MAPESVAVCPTFDTIPAGWEVKRLGSFCTKIGTGATPRGGSEVYLNARISHALVRSQHVFDRKFDSTGLAFITESHARELRNAEVQSGDILLNITGDGVTFGRACIVPDRILPACVNQHVSIIRSDRSVCNPGYLLSFLTHPATKHYIESFNSGGSRRAITKGHIESFEVPLPPLIEQNAIAAILGTLDDKIELNRRMNETLEGIARAIFRSWFVDFDPVRAKAAGQSPPGLALHIAALFPDRFEDSELGEIPQGWKVGTIGEIAMINERTLRQKDTLDAIDYIEISEVMRGEIGTVTRYARGQEPRRARRRVAHGDTALSTVRPDRGAYLLVLDPADSLILSTGFAVLSAKDGNWAFLHIATTRSEFGAELGHLADGGAYPAVRPEVVAARRLAIPSNPQFIAEFELIVQPMLMRANANREECRTLAALRDTLLPKMISGELRVPDAERIVGRCV